MTTQARAWRPGSAQSPQASLPRARTPRAALQLSPPLGFRSNPHVSAVLRTVLTLLPQLCPWLN